MALNFQAVVAGRILRPHSMVLPYPKALGERFEEFAMAVNRAGREFAVDGAVLPETEALTSRPFMDNETMVEASNRWWELAAGQYSDRK